LEKSPAAARKLENKYNGGLKDLEAAIDAKSKMLDGYTNRLATWSDSRSVNAVAAVLTELSEGKLAASEGWFMSSPHTLPAIDALLALGCRKSVTTVVDARKAWSETLKRYETRLKKLKKGKQPSEQELTQVRDVIERLKAHLTEISERLRKFALAAKRRPPASFRSQKEWKKWVAKVHGKLPRSLGSVSSSEED